MPYYLSNTVCKLFADDTTLVFAGSDCVDAVNELKKTVMPLLEWCENNYMYVNWSKTYAMFVTTKRTTRPDTIRIDSGTIEIVDTFKLLGVTIDSRLNFLNHVHTISKSIFSKLYAIKRLFFLSFNVKMLFFKTFILPYFDYCLSLIIYFSKTAISKITKIFYICLYKLFKFNFSNYNIHEINNHLNFFVVCYF